MQLRHLVILLASVGALGPAWLSAQCPDGSPPPCGRAAARAPAPNSVAVLYFDNPSRDTADTFLADGLTEEFKYHEVTDPSFLNGQLDRYVAWYDKYLKPSASQVGREH
jgi:hypothetical protein